MCVFGHFVINFINIVLSFQPPSSSSVLFLSYVFDVPKKRTKLPEWGGGGSYFWQCPKVNVLFFVRSSLMSFRLFVSLSSCLRCENKDLFRRILGILLCQANLQPTKILLCQGNLQHQRQPKSPRSEYFSSTLANFQKYSRYLKTNQLSIYFQRYLHLISHTFVLP